METYLAAHSDQPMDQEISFTHKDGHIVWILSRRKGILDHQHRLIRMVGTLTNISALKESQQSLENLAYRDFLTQVSNRPAFSDTLLRGIDRAKRQSSILGLIFIDIDNFKQINDQFGHDFGDATLCEVVRILNNVSRSIDFMARLGGDEFGVVLEDVADSAEVCQIAARYIAAFAEPIMVANKRIKTSISIGVALYPENGSTDVELLKIADKNLYRAKDRGKNQYVWI